MTTPSFTLTNDTLVLVWEGKIYNIKKDSPQFIHLRKALVEEHWNVIPNYLTVGSTLTKWAKGRYTVSGEVVHFDGTPIPEELNKRILEMATANEDPTPIFNFWERLQRNPSWRSVQQLWAFLQHTNIPLTPDGCFLAYKAVNYDYLDKHSRRVNNKPGTINKMPRNQISDDPTQTCHFGFHVGALGYVSSFGSGDDKIIICKVDPEHVVCVPNDHSGQKMRVCEYEVIGNYGGPLPSTTFSQEAESRDEPGDEPEFTEKDDSDENEVTPVPEVKEPVKTKSKSEWAKWDAMDFGELMGESIEELRQYATHGVNIIGASKIPGGKIALVTRICEVRD
jgi:hypothetical protein